MFMAIRKVHIVVEFVHKMIDGVVVRVMGANGCVKGLLYYLQNSCHLDASIEVY